MYSAAKEDLLMIPKGLDHMSRDRVILKAKRELIRSETSKRRKAENPERILLRDDPPSVQLARHLQRINDEISLGSSKLEASCRENVRRSFINPSASFDVSRLSLVNQYPGHSSKVARLLANQEPKMSPYLRKKLGIGPTNPE